MIFRFLALSAFVSTPFVLLLTERSTSVLRGSIFGGSSAGEDAVDSSQLPQHGSLWNMGIQLDENEEPEQTATTTPCPVCPPCDGGARPAHTSVLLQVILQLERAADVNFDRLVLVFALHYGAGALAVGWAIGSIRRGSRPSSRASSLAAQGDRPRGAGNRAGLQAPGGLR